MASLADAAEVTLRLEALTGELRREACDRGGDFSQMADLADEVAEVADGLAEVFERANGALEDAWAKWPIAAPTREHPEEPGPRRVLASYARRFWARIRRFFSSPGGMRRAEQPRRGSAWWRERPHPELLLFR